MVHFQVGGQPASHYTEEDFTLSVQETDLAKLADVNRWLLGSVYSLLSTRLLVLPSPSSVAIEGHLVHTYKVCTYTILFYSLAAK